MFFKRSRGVKALISVLLIGVGLVVVVFAVKFTSDTETSTTSGSLEIDNFYTLIEIDRNNSAKIQERIDVIFPKGAKPAHGVLRLLPIWENLKYANFKLFRDNDAAVLPIEPQETGGGTLELRIGDKEYSLAYGTTTFLLSYTASGLFSASKEKGTDDLFWTLTNEGFSIPIKKPLLEISLPDLIRKEDIILEPLIVLTETELVQQVDQEGSELEFRRAKTIKALSAIEAGLRIKVWSPRPLLRGENLAVRLSVAEGFLHPPSETAPLL